MNPEVFRRLSPLVDRVQEAQGDLNDLNDVNTDPDAHPLEALKWAGRVIKGQQELSDTMWELLDVAGEPVTEQTQLLIQGRLRAAQESEGT